MAILLLSPLFLLTLVASQQYQTPLRSNAPQNTNTYLPQNIDENYGLAIEAIFNVGLRLQALLEEPSQANSKNFLVSPLSLTVALGQLMCGADPKLQDQLYGIMSLPHHYRNTHLTVTYNDTSKKTYDVNYSQLHLQLGRLIKAFENEGKAKDPNFILDLASVLFANKNMHLHEKFKYFLQMYQTEIEPTNFTTDPLGSQKFINDWSANHTNNLIKKILPEPLPRTAAAVFANSIYFKADWETPFSSEISKVGNFSVTATKNVLVTFMRGEFYIPYVENDVCRMIGLPYQNGEVAMYIILPKKDNGNEYDIRAFVDKLKVKDVLELKNATRLRDVTLMLPKMELTNTLSVLDNLRKYTVYKNASRRNRTGTRRPSTPGVARVPLHKKDDFQIVDERVNMFKNFQGSYDDVEIRLTEASDDNFVVSNILQQMTLSVNEKGTEAAAITSSTIDYIGGSKVFRVERPFLFFISHEATSAALFWGTIVDPTQSQKLM